MKNALAEFTATAFLLIAVVGSGIAAERLCGGNIGLALLVNAVVTGCALFPLILAFGPVSGAHMNPVVTLAAAVFGQLPWRRVPPYLIAQVLGAVHEHLERVRERQELDVDRGEGVDVARLTRKARHCVV